MFAIAVLAITVLGVILARLVVGPLADWVSNSIDAPARRFAEHHSDPTRLERADQVSVFGGFGLTIVIVVIVGALWWLRTRDPRPAIVLAAALLGAAFVTIAVKYAVHRSPASGTTPRFSAGTFPSGHALLATAVYGTLAVLVVRARARGRSLRVAAAGLLLLAAVVVGASRVYNLDHYASDVLGSFVLGVTVVIAAAVFDLQLARTARPGDPPA